MQQLPIHVLFKFSILCSQLGVLAFSLSWSLVTCNESKQLCQEYNIQVFTFGEKLELSSVLKIKTITLPVPILFAEWVLAFQHCKRVFQQNYAQQKRRQKNAQYNNINVEMSHTVSKSYWFDSIYDYTCLFDHFCGWPAPSKVFWVQTSSSYGAKQKYYQSVPSIKKLVLFPNRHEL